MLKEFIESITNKKAVYCSKGVDNQRASLMIYSFNIYIISGETNWENHAGTTQEMFKC